MIKNLIDKNQLKYLLVLLERRKGDIEVLENYGVKTESLINGTIKDEIVLINVIKDILVRTI